MTIEFACPSCGGALRVEDDAVGQVVRCGGCMTMLRVPDMGASAPHAPVADAGPAFPAGPAAFPEAEQDSPQPSVQPPVARPLPKPRPVDEPPRPPRRRRSRREPPQLGTSPTVWVLVTFGVLGVGSCLLCGGFAAFLQKAEWQPVEPKNGGFKVDFPAAPKPHFRPRLFQPGKDFTVEGTRVFGSNEEFVVLYKDLDNVPKGEDRDERILDNEINQLRTGGIKPLGNSVSLDVSGFPARDFEFQATQGGRCMARMIVADHRVYLLVAGVNFGVPEADRVQHFFNSFEITDPKLLAAAAKRKDHIQQQPPKQDNDRKPPPIRFPVHNPINTQRGVRELGRNLGDVPFPRIIVEGETARQIGVAALGGELGSVAFQQIVAEQELAHTHELGTAVSAAAERVAEADRQRMAVAGLGSALTMSSYEAAAAEQARVAEAARIQELGLLIGKAVAAAVEGALDTKEKPK